MSNTHQDERERLEREANLVRAKLATTLDVLDRRGHDMVDVKLQVKRHVVPLAVVAGTVALGVVSVFGYAVFRLATRAERKRLERRRIPARVWNHPERVAQVQKRPILVEIGRKLLVSTATLLGMSLIRRAIQSSSLPARQASSAMPALDVHHS